MGMQVPLCKPERVSKTSMEADQPTRACSSAVSTQRHRLARKQRRFLRLPHSALGISALLLALPHTAAAACGATVFAQGFAHYPGPYRPWSRDMAAADFNVSDTARPSTAGVVLKPGIDDDASAGFENVLVGRGRMRLKFFKVCSVRSAHDGTVNPLRIDDAVCNALRQLHHICHVDALALLPHQLDQLAGCVGTDKGCGVRMTLRLPAPMLEATLSYRVRFSEGFGWTQGGKLPGAPSL